MDGTTDPRSVGAPRWPEGYSSADAGRIQLERAYEQLQARGVPRSQMFSGFANALGPFSSACVAASAGYPFSGVRFAGYPPLGSPVRPAQEIPPAAPPVVEKPAPRARPGLATALLVAWALVGSVWAIFPAWWPQPSCGWVLCAILPTALLGFGTIAVLASDALAFRERKKRLT